MWAHSTWMLACTQKPWAVGNMQRIIDALRDHGYGQREALRRFQLLRQVRTTDGGAPIDIVVDFLMPRDAAIVKNIPTLISDFAVQRADGADLAKRATPISPENSIRSMASGRHACADLSKIPRCRATVARINGSRMLSGR
jgi:hypothetical protein